MCACVNSSLQWQSIAVFTDRFVLPGNAERIEYSHTHLLAPICLYIWLQFLVLYTFLFPFVRYNIRS